MEGVWQYVREFISKYLVMPKVYVSDIVEVFIIAIIVYYVMLWFKKTHAWTIFKGLIVLMLLLILAAIFNLSTILWIANKTLSVGVIAIVIIFQPELRKALEDLGNKNILLNVFKTIDGGVDGRISDRAVEEIVRATLELAKTKTGALIVIERENDLSDFTKTGIVLNSEISSQLLINIFEHNTPLHDGAVIIENNKISAATCYLPLSENRSLPKELGTRHRAGVGVSEVSDSFVIVVSEETGSISIATEGRLIRYADAGILKSELAKVQDKAVQKEEKKKNRIFRRRNQDEEVTGDDKINVD